MLSRPGTGLLCSLLIHPVLAADLTARNLRIESTPPGAEVFLIGGRSGQTPLEVSERAIYPNDYPDDRAYLYGTVTLRHDGCTPHVHRVTLEDIELGLHITLDCADETMSSGARTPAGPVGTPASFDSDASPTESESLSQRRLRQLQVLQELLDEGLMSATEERRIRRRLLEMP